MNIYFKHNKFDIYLKILFIDIKIYLGSLLKLIFSLLKKENYKSTIQIFKHNNSENILIIEVNNFHSEIFPSWLFYLKNLSFNGKILFASTNKESRKKSFDLLNKKNNFEYYSYKIDPKIILFYFKLGLLKKYKKVIFNSDFFYPSNISARSYLLNLVKNNEIFKNTILLSHQPFQSINNNKNDIVDIKKQLLTISPFLSKITNIKYIVPIFNINKLNYEQEKNKFNRKKIFTSCGNIKIKEKDSEALEKALKKTKDLKKNINIIGKAPKSLKNSAEINYYKNFISFLELRQIMKESHFILFLLNEDKSYSYKYEKSSGILPLALNFNLIPIIEESFASFYCLDKSNAIIYKNGELDKAIKYACNMTYNEYISLKNTLNDLKYELFKNSLDNLKTLLH